MKIQTARLERGRFRVAYVARKSYLESTSAIDVRLVDATCSRHMNDDSDEVDAEFLAWVKANANDCSHEAMERALAETEHLCRRPRLLHTEFWYASIRAVVFSKPGPWGRFDARAHLGASDRAIDRARRAAPRCGADAAAAPPLTEERVRKILVDNLEIAERSGNHRAAELLRRQLKRA
jgi:hypothetical protein